MSEKKALFRFELPDETAMLWAADWNDARARWESLRPKDTNYIGPLMLGPDSRRDGEILNPEEGLSS